MVILICFIACNSSFVDEARSFSAIICMHASSFTAIFGQSRTCAAGTLLLLPLPEDARALFHDGANLLKIKLKSRECLFQTGQLQKKGPTTHINDRTVEKSNGYYVMN
jgi:hypothetical protein